MHTKWNGPTVAYIDMLFTLAIIFIAMSVLAPKPAPPVQAAGDKALCMMAIDIQWPGNVTSDVDLWVKTPENATSIGFSNAHSVVADLVRDDLGELKDNSGHHSERTCLRSIPDGTYTVGIDLFRHDMADLLPINTTLVISSVDPSTGYMTVVFTTEVKLPALRQEVTAVNFTIKDGQLLQDSVNFIPTPIKGYK